MGALTETEIFSCLSENFREAADNCEKLARLPRKGPIYAKLRDNLQLIEGAARQAGHWREDSRWFAIGLAAAEYHKRAGDWLRGIKGPGGVRIAIPRGTLHPLFVKLAEKMKACQKLAEEFRTKATGRVGMILPDVQPAPHRDTRPISVLLPPALRKTQGGLIIPPGVSLSPSTPTVQ